MDVDERALTPLPHTGSHNVDAIAQTYAYDRDMSDFTPLFSLPHT